MGLRRGGIQSLFLLSQENMKSPIESEALTPTEVSSSMSSSWAKVGFVAAASAILGGLAAAWWYRKTLKTLRQTEEFDSNPKFGINSDESDRA